MKKTCNVCKLEKPVTDFFKKGSGYQYRCKLCVKAASLNKRYDTCSCGRKKLITSAGCKGCTTINTRELYDPDLVERVKLAYLSGKSTWKVAEELGTNQMRIRRILIRSGVSMRENNFVNRGNFGKDNPTWNGYEEISGGYFNIIRTGAAKRNITFEITIEQMWEQFKKQDRKCALTGLPIVLPRSDESRIIGEWTASFDRKDSNLGYVDGNVQFVHKRVNIMKGNLPETEFRYICKLIVEHSDVDIVPVEIKHNLHHKRKI